MKYIKCILSAGVIVVGSGQVMAATSSVTDAECNSRLDLTIASTTRTSTTSSIVDHCQTRALTTASGFAVSTSNPLGATVPDSSAMQLVDGELYEAFVGGFRDGAVLFTPNRSLLMSRNISGNTKNVDWNMGLVVQPVTSGANSWLAGTYSFLRANVESRSVDDAHQTNSTLAALSQVFDPVTMRITFNGAGGCSVANYSSWLSYSLTTDPLGGYSQPNGSDYGLHQAVYAGGDAVSVHKDANLTFTNCEYTLGTDGKLLVSYSYTDGSAGAHTVENAYFVSSDLRYIVPTVNSGSNLYRGFEMGVRVKGLTGSQDAMNDSVAGTFLFNSPSVELEGATGVLSAPYNEHRNSEKSIRCMGRGSLVLSTDSSATVGWNTCSLDMASTCSVRGEEGTAPSIAISHYTGEGTLTASTCRFQISNTGTLSLVANLNVAEGAQDVTFSGAVADNAQALVLRGKYVGTSMTNPSNSSPPQRTIKNDLLLMTMVGIKHSTALTANAFDKFVLSSYNAVTAVAKNDMDNDGDSDIFWRRADTGQSQIWLMQGGVRNTLNDLGYTATKWSFAGLGDFNADGDKDVLLRDNVTGEMLVQRIENGLQQSAASIGYNSAALTFQATGDLDGDGDDDVLLRNNATSEFKGNFMQDHVSAGTSTLGYNKTTLTFKGLADVDGDGDKDIVQRDDSTAEIKVQVLQGGVNTGPVSFGYNTTAHSFKAILDADGDGDDDFLLRKDSDGSMIIVENEGGHRLRVNSLGYNSTALSFVGTGDFDGDGDQDILLRNGSTGELVTVMLQNSTKASGGSIGYVATRFGFVGVGDFDGDGDDDLLFRDSSTGENVRVAMQNGAIALQGQLNANNVNLVPHLK